MAILICPTSVCNQGERATEKSKSLPVEKFEASKASVTQPDRTAFRLALTLFLLLTHVEKHTVGTHTGRHSLPTLPRNYRLATVLTGWEAKNFS